MMQLLVILQIMFSVALYDIMYNASISIQNGVVMESENEQNNVMMGI